MMRLHLLFLACTFIVSSCSVENPTPARKLSPLPDRTTEQEHWNAQRIDIISRQITDSAEQFLKDSGLVNVKSLNPDILVDLKYSSTDNIAGIDMYGEIKNAYLRPEVAAMLAHAQELLTDTIPGYRLLVFDAVRPLSVQQIIWDSTSLPLNLKTRYLSNPKNHSIHNYGAAVDLTIAGPDGTPLDMGTPFDFFGPEAQPIMESKMVKEGRLTTTHISNRELLRHVMTRAGFRTFPYEWWHFNALTRDQARKKYTLIP